MNPFRLVLDPTAFAFLIKARAKGGAGPGQMSLFGGGAPGQGPKPTEAATHVEIRPVAAHLRETAHGPVQVAAHTAHLRVAAPTPATEEPVSVAPAVTGSPTFAIPPAPAVDQEIRLRQLDVRLDALDRQVQHHRKNRQPIPDALKQQIDENKRAYAELTGKGTPAATASAAPSAPTAVHVPVIPDGLAHVAATARIRIRHTEKLAHREDGQIVEYHDPVECTICGKPCTVKVFHLSNGEKAGQDCAATLVNLSDVAASRGYQVTPDEATRHYGHANGRQLAYLQRAGIVSAAQPVSNPLEKAMPGPTMTMRAGPAKPAAPASPAPPPDPAMNPGPHGAIPPTPGQRVKFKHPATGEETEGHIHAQGGQGATVVDGQGATHRVPHGGYMHVHDATPPGGGEVKPSAELVKQAARKHLELGPSAPLAIYATAALLSIGGVQTVHELNASDVRIKGGCLYVDQDKLKTDDPAVVQMVQQLQHQSPKGPLFQVQGQPMTEEALTQYVRRFGTPQGAGPNPTPPATMAKAQRLVALHKASAAALILPVTPDTTPAASWRIGDYLIEFRKGSHGVGMCTVDGPGMPIPLHEIVSDAASARQFATAAVQALRKGEAPSRGVFQATR